jgi:UDP-4-amino-4,6-dideoxy-N-acetyl-beta-L-altrosamine transaminase
MIPYGRQNINDVDIESVVSVLRSDFLTQGPAVPAFESALQELTGARFAVGVNSATSALHIACMALEVGPSSRVWTSPNTFSASANCALYCGAAVDFVDIDARSYNLCPDRLAAKLAVAERAGQLPAVLIVVHFSGQPCAMAKIRALGNHYGFKIIEDASHAVGASHAGEPVGRGTFSDITVFSFHPVKIVTTGEGGAALTNDAALAERMRMLRTHGIVRDPALMTGPVDGPWYYEQMALGYNYRLTDLQAALGITQLGRLAVFVARRRQLAARYNRLLADLPLILPWQSDEGLSAWHLYVVRVRSGGAPERLRLFGALRDAGIGSQVHYIPVYLHPWYRRLGFQRGYCPVAESYYATALSLPLYFGLTEEQQDKVVDVMRRELV